MTLSWFPGGRSGKTTLLFIALSLIASTVVLLASPKNWFLAELTPGSADWAARDCAYNERNRNDISLTQDDCRLTEGDGRPVYLIGDSNAAHHSNGLMLASERLERPLFVRYAGSCPTVPVSMTSEAGKHEMEERDADNRCLPWLDFVRSELENAEDGSVLLTMSPTYWNEEYVAVSTLSNSARSNQKVILEEALLEQVKEISAMGHQVVLISPMVWPQFVCRETLVNLIHGQICSSATDGISRWNADALSSFRQVARELPVKLVDLTEVQCPHMKCVRTLGGVTVYSLGYSHLSAEFGTLTSPRFLEILEVVD